MANHSIGFLFFLFNWHTKWAHSEQVDFVIMFSIRSYFLERLSFAYRVTSLQVCPWQIVTWQWYRLTVFRLGYCVFLRESFRLADVLVFVFTFSCFFQLAFSNCFCVVVCYTSLKSARTQFWLIRCMETIKKREWTRRSLSYSPVYLWFRSILLPLPFSCWLWLSSCSSRWCR